MDFHDSRRAWATPDFALASFYVTAKLAQCTCQFPVGSPPPCYVDQLHKNSNHFSPRIQVYNSAHSTTNQHCCINRPQPWRSDALSLPVHHWPTNVHHHDSAPLACSAYKSPRTAAGPSLRYQELLAPTHAKLRGHVCHQKMCMQSHHTTDYINFAFLQVTQYKLIFCSNQLTRIFSCTWYTLIHIYIYIYIVYHRVVHHILSLTYRHVQRRCCLALQSLHHIDIQLSPGSQQHLQPAGKGEAGIYIHLKCVYREYICIYKKVCICIIEYVYSVCHGKHHVLKLSKLVYPILLAHVQKLC